jgi:excisionase family DNA binding protein
MFQMDSTPCRSVTVLGVTLDESMADVIRRVLREEVRQIVREELERHRAEEAPEIMSVDEAATMARVHHATVREWVKDGSLRASRTGKRRGIIIRREELLARLARAPAVRDAPVDVDAFVAQVMAEQDRRRRDR